MQWRWLWSMDALGMNVLWRISGYVYPWSIWKSEKHHDFSVCSSSFLLLPLLFYSICSDASATLLLVVIIVTKDTEFCRFISVWTHPSFVTGHVTYLLSFKCIRNRWRANASSSVDLFGPSLMDASCVLVVNGTSGRDRPCAASSLLP